MTRRMVKIHGKPSAPSSTATSRQASAAPSRAPSPTPLRQPFRFFDLPSELRLRVYEELLLTKDPLDLDSSNHRNILPRLALFLVSRRMYAEAHRIFYSGNTIRLFPSPNHGRFFHTKRPLLARLPSHTRSTITTLELRLGPGWSSPPKCQNTSPTLGLRDCHSLRMLKIMVELDPSDSVFAGFRGKGATEETYKWFCVGLLQGILEQVPALRVVEIDAFPAVKKDAPLIQGLRKCVEEVGHGLRWTWSLSRAWDEDSKENVVDVTLRQMKSSALAMEIAPTEFVGRVVRVGA